MNSEKDQDYSLYYLLLVTFLSLFLGASALFTHDWLVTDDETFRQGLWQICNSTAEVEECFPLVRVEISALFLLFSVMLSLLSNSLVVVDIIGNIQIYRIHDVITTLIGFSGLFNAGALLSLSYIFSSTPKILERDAHFGPSFYAIVISIGASALMTLMVLLKKCSKDLDILDKLQFSYYRKKNEVDDV